MEKKYEYQIAMPFTGIAYRTIIAESEEDAIALFIGSTTLNIGSPKDETDAEIEEWDFCEAIVTGNVFHGCANEVLIENMGESEGD